MANDYIEVANNIGMTGALKLDLASHKPGSVAAVSNRQTLGGGNLQSFNAAKARFECVAMVRYNDARAGYAKLADVRTWFNAVTLAAATYYVRLLEDSTVFTMLLENRGQFQPEHKSAAPFSTNSVWHVPLVWLQQ